MGKPAKPCGIHRRGQGQPTQGAEHCVRVAGCAQTGDGGTLPAGLQLLQEDTRPTLQDKERKPLGKRHTGQGSLLLGDRKARADALHTLGRRVGRPPPPPPALLLRDCRIDMHKPTHTDPRNRRQEEGTGCGESTSSKSPGGPGRRGAPILTTGAAPIQTSESHQTTVPRNLEKT